MKTTALLLLLLLTGCQNWSPKPEKTITVSNPAYAVDQLFTAPGGVAIYRFFDQGDYRYYIVGPNGAQMLPSTTHVTDTLAQSDISGGGGDGHIGDRGDRDGSQSGGHTK